MTTFARSACALNVKIAALAVRHLAGSRWPELVISRNLYAAYVLGVSRGGLWWPSCTTSRAACAGPAARRPQTTRHSGRQRFTEASRFRDQGKGHHSVATAGSA
jgi:hypothetical protein